MKTTAPWKNLSAWVLLLILPPLIAFWQWRHRLPDLYAGRLAELEQTARDLASGGQLQTEHRRMLIHAGRTLVADLNRNDWIASRPLRLPWQMQRFTDLQIAVFDREGALFSPPEASAQAKFLWKKLWLHVQAGEIPLKELPAFQRLFGPRFDNELFSWENLGYTQFSHQGSGLIFWKRGPGRSGVFLHSFGPQNPLTPWKFWLNHSRNLISGDIWVIDTQTRRMIGSRKAAPEEKRLFRRILWGQRTGMEVSRSNLYLVAGGKDRFLVVVGFSRPFQRLEAMDGLTVALLFLLVPLAIIISRYGSPADLPLSLRLVLLFGIVVTLPIIPMAGTTLEALGAHQARILDLIQDRHLGRLRDLDSVFAAYMEKEDHLCRNLSSKVRNASSLESIREILEEGRCAEHFWDYQLIDSAGRMILASRVTHGLTSMGEMFLRGMQSRYLGEAKTFDTSVVMAMTPLLRSSVLSFASLSDRPDRWTFLTTGTDMGLVFWSVFPPVGPGLPSAVVLGGLPNAVRTGFLQTLPAGTYAYDNLQQRWFPRSPPVPCPGSLLGSGLQQPQGGSRVILSRGRRFLMTLLPSGKPELRQIAFLTCTDLDAAEAGVKWLRFQDLVLILVCFFLVGVAVRILSRLFLVPIQKLSEGVAAIQGGDQAFRLPLLGSDEFGQVGIALNQMLEDLGEHDRAARVQTNLIPRHPLSLPGFETALRYLPLNGLAGDYADTISRPDDTLFLTVGDVTGHGVGAALMAAMAKMICHTACLEKIRLPDLVFRLGRVVHQVGGRRQMMTFFCADLDGKTGVLEWIVAGHPYPILVHPDGRLEELQMKGYPLGFFSNKPFSSISQTLPVGAALVVYTDGLIEALSESGEMFGYQRLEAVLSGSPLRSAEELADRIMAAHAVHAGSVLPNDDTTLVIVYRPEGGAAQGKRVRLSALKNFF
jgi:serine phosphatase RsbU (regulator of sigma subunit)